MQRALPHSLKHLVTRRASPEARNLVLGLISQNPPLTIQDLYKLTTKEQQAQQPESSDPNSLPIPSMRYLKKVVLPDLEQEGVVEKVHTKEPLSEEELERMRANLAKSRKTKPVALSSHVAYWRWQLRQARDEEPLKEEKRRFGTEVGVGEDWSHLNKRRQRAREEKVARDVAWLKELEAARREGMSSRS
ncbi:hypothetical protein C8Q76DRAFT_737144 [Earliella scabrosa]|nr:hypothetical protein C8Q76DRAFT_737144 [Earliella scabrosa]